MNLSHSNTLNFNKAGLIQGVIFDMDGTLIDSETLWMVAEREVFSREGFQLSEEKFRDGRGLPTLDAVKFWLGDQEPDESTVLKIVSDINNKAEELILERGSLMSGVVQVLEFFNSKGLPMAVASSSKMNLIQGVISNHKLEDFFKLLYSGDSELVGKPHPGIFLSVARELKVDPQSCIVFEDSVNGIRSAKAAQMKVVAFLSDGNTEDTKYDIADMKLESFHNFGPSEYEYLELQMKKP